jgi:hypothetical protein
LTKNNCCILDNNKKNRFQEIFVTHIQGEEIHIIVVGSSPGFHNLGRSERPGDEGDMGRHSHESRALAAAWDSSDNAARFIRDVSRRRSNRMIND